MQNDLTLKQIDWFNLSDIGVYITPELICGKPCVLLLDTGLLFKDHKVLGGRLDQFGFQPINFEFSPGVSNYLYVLFADSISSDLFYKNLKIPHHNIKRFRQSLSQIQDLFYELSEKIFKFRVDVIIKSSKHIGLNNQLHDVYDSKFGRYKLNKLGHLNSTIEYHSEDRNERSVSFLRATTAQDVLYCCEGFIKQAIETGRNISLMDVQDFTKVLYCPSYKLPTEFEIKPHQLNLVLGAFGALYIKHIGSMVSNYPSLSDFFDSIGAFKSVCLAFEACPSIPRAIYTPFLANTYNTPAPLAFVMQKLLISGDSPDKCSLTVLDSMAGVGSLTSFLAYGGYSVHNIELNPKTCMTSRLLKTPSVKVENGDSIEDGIFNLTKEKKPWGYTIGNPAHLPSSKVFEYSDAHGSITLDRSDLISIIKDLMVRENNGRSVYLIPYFTNETNLLYKLQATEIEAFLGFINSRYRIEGVSCISSEIYSKSLQRVSPIMLIIGKKRVNYVPSNKMSLKEIIANTIEDYEALWDWSNLICYQRSSYYSIDNENYELALKEPFTSNISGNSPVLLDFSTSDDKTESGGNFITSTDNLFDFAILKHEPSSPLDANDELDQGLHENIDNEGTIKSSGENQTNDDAESTDSHIEDSEQTIDDTHGATDSIKATDEITPQPKLNKGNVNLFNITQKNKIIRYHSVATLSEPTSNVRQSEFSAYLKARKNLGGLISSAFDQINPLHKNQIDKLVNYISMHGLEPTPEAFISAHLDLSTPKICTSALLPEHIDFISSAIIKLSNKESIMILDSVGLDTPTPIIALFKYAQINNKGVVYCAKDPSMISLIESKLNNLGVVFGLNEPDIRYIYDVEHIIPAFEGFNKNTVVFIVDNAKTPLSSKGITVKSLPSNESFITFYEPDMDGRKPSSNLITHILKSPTVFLASDFINPETDLSTLQTLFTKDVFDRFFNPGFGDLDEMSCHLLKVGMIENLSLLQRLEDLSKITTIESTSNTVWSGKYSVLAGSYGLALNNIVLLSEMIHMGKADGELKTSLIREQAMQIYELCAFCINSVPITYSIFNAIKNNSKPIVVMPKNIEGLIFSILEKLNVDFIPNKKYEYIGSLAQLNSEIINIDYELSNYDNYDDNYPLLIIKLADLVFWRTSLINTYFTSQKNGSYSKYPDLTGVISAFYVYCTSGLDSSHEQYDILYQKAKDVEIEISSLVDLPLCVADFMQYELNEHQIKCAELSSRTFSLSFNKEAEKWDPTDMNPAILRRMNTHDNRVVELGFNRGDFDVLFVEADEITGMDFSSKVIKGDIASDHIRKRCLIITYFNKPINHYLNIIGAVNSHYQTVPAEIMFEVPAMPSYKVGAALIRKQLELFNIKNSEKLEVDLSYYLTPNGKQLLQEYLNLNPSYLAHRPNLPIKSWDIYTVLDVINMVSEPIQLNIIEHLHHFVIQHLSYLKVSKRNPFDVFSISPKTKFDKVVTGDELTYLNKRLTDRSNIFSKGIECVSLSYAKSINNPLSLTVCKSLRDEALTAEKTRLKGLLVGLFGAESEHLVGLSYSELLNIYIAQFTRYFISTYRDRVISMLHDRYKNWIFHNNKKLNKLTYVKNHFTSASGLRVASTLQGLYAEILMLADLELIKTFEDSCKVLSFLRAYQTTIQKIEKNNLSNLMVLPISSPFSDNNYSHKEGLLIRLNLPGSLMIALTPKSFTVSVAYPLKSKPTDLNLAYILENQDVMGGQSVLTNLTDREMKAVCAAYTQSKFLDILKNKISNLNYVKVTGFKTIDDLNKSSIMLSEFNIKAKGFKIRNLNVFYGNLFEIYRFLKDIVPLTLVSFINDRSLTEYGFLIPSDVEPSYVIDALNRVVSPGNLPVIYKYFQVNSNHLKNIKSIEMMGSSGNLSIGQLGRDSISVTFSGTEAQLQNILLDKDLFLEYATATEQIDLSKVTKSKLKVNNTLAKFTPLDISSAVKRSRGSQKAYMFKLDQQSLDVLLTLICNKKIYNVAMFDCSQKHDRIQLGLRLNS